MVGPIIYNLFIILGAYLLGPRMGITGMAVGTVVGACANFLLQFAVLLRVKWQYRPTLQLSHPGIKQMLRLMLPAILGLSITQLNQIITQNLASGLAQGSITALQLANRLMQFPLGIFAMATSQVYFPTMTRQVAQGQMDAFRETFSKGLRSILFVTIPSAAGLIVLRVPLVSFLFETGEFTASDTMATAHALLYYCLGLAAQSGIQIITRIYYSLQDTKTPVKISVITMVLNTGLSLFLLITTSLAHGALALAYSASAVLSFCLYLLILRGKLGRIDGRRLVSTIVKATVASGVMALAVVWAGKIITPYLAGKWWATTAQVLVLSGWGVLVYGLITYGLRMEEAQEILDIFLRRFKARFGKE